MTYIEQLGEKAVKASGAFCGAGTDIKNAVLLKIADELLKNSDKIIKANAEDLEYARKNGRTEAFIERLTLNKARVIDLCGGIKEVAALPDPIGEVIGGSEKNGFNIVKKRVPLGVIGMIFESRPNVATDAAALCIKSGNICILRGGKDALNSNKCLAEIMRSALTCAGLPADTVQLVEDVSHETAVEMMKLNKYIDVLIPRGGEGLIQSVVQNSTIPVIETGTGNCHIYIDEHADLDKAVLLTDNAKTQRPSVCNSIESMLVNKKIASEFFKKLDALWQGKVKIYGDEETSKYIKIEKIAEDADYAEEFLDFIISSKVVDGIDEAISHINRFGTRHSECIVTERLQNAERFQREIDAAAVYVNVSTRFTDGNVFGLGAEIGISNQKLHARGPVGLTELTTYKYLITGNGQIRK